MGNNYSTTTTNELIRPQRNNEDDNLMESATAFDEELLSLRRHLKMDQEAFLLNNLMLCVQFFENYEREISDIKAKVVSRRERDLNTVLSQNRKHVLVPDILQEKVSTHVKFESPKSVDCDFTVEPIQPVRIYVVLENIKVLGVTEKQDYSTTNDSMVYKMRLDPSTNYGFVKIRSLNKTAIDPKTDRDRSMTTSYSDHKPNRGSVILGVDKLHFQSNLTLHLQHPDDEGYEESSYGEFAEHRSGDFSKQNKHSKHRRSVESIPRSSKSSGYKSGSSGTNYIIENGLDYDCATIASSRTSLISSVCLPTSSTEIPVACFKKFVCTRDGKLYSDESKRPKFNNAADRRIRKAEQYQTQELSYLRKDKFRRYFEKLFVNRLATPLGFDIEDETDVTRQGAIIHCYSIEAQADDLTLVTPYEIIPSIAAEWPECGKNWLQRSRQAVLNSENNEHWLTEEIIDEVEKLGCHIIPESFATTKNSDPYHVVEWQINLPAAERHLGTCLNHSQAHVYLMSLVLHRSFIKFGLTASHIRSQLFWLLDKNCSSSMWSENRTGENLRELLAKLHNSVSQRQPFLEDYFISKKNLFENIPIQYLHTTHKQLKRIIDNPVMYLIASMKNIKYKPDFFPVFDYRRLHKLLTLEYKKLVAYINPALSSVNGAVQQAGIENIKESKEDFDRLGKNVRTIENNKNSIGRTNAASHELIVEITDECRDLTGLRLSVILDLFIKHFIEMAECCHSYGTVKQRDVYLNQAYRLSIILSDEPRGKEDASRYLKKIDTLRHRFPGFNDQNNVPETPERNYKSAISIPLNKYFTETQDHNTSILSNTIETRDFDVHYSSEKSQSEVSYL